MQVYLLSSRKILIHLRLFTICLSIYYLFILLVHRDDVCLISKEIKDVHPEVFPLLHLTFWELCVLWIQKCEHGGMVTQASPPKWTCSWIGISLTNIVVLLPLPFQPWFLDGFHPNSSRFKPSLEQTFWGFENWISGPLVPWSSGHPTSPRGPSQWCGLSAW